MASSAHSGGRREERDAEGAENLEKVAESGHSSTQSSNQETREIGIFHPAIKEIRMRAYQQWVITILGLGAFIIAVLSIYWGVLATVYSRLDRVTVWIVDFDSQVAPYNTTSPIVGPFIANEFTQLHPDQVDNLGWTVKPAADFDHDPVNVRRAIYNEDAYVAIIINPNATTLLKAAVNDGNSSYDPTGATQVVYITARDQTTVSSYILPALLDTLPQVISKFGIKWATILGQNASAQDVFRTPQAVNPAIGFSLLDLRPFTPAVAVPSVSIGLIYLIIISFFSFSFLMPIHSLFFRLKQHQTVHIWQILIWRIISSILAYFFLSLFYSLISLAFQMPFSNSPAPYDTGAVNPNAYGKASFFVYWMLNFIGMGALGLPCENMAMILGMPFSSLWLIFWVITNVATSFYELELASDFYLWGHAWPLYRIVHGSRTILFDTKSTIGLDFGVLFAWIGVSIIVFPFANFVMNWRTGVTGRRNRRGSGQS